MDVTAESDSRLPEQSGSRIWQFARAAKEYKRITTMKTRGHFTC